MPPTDGNNPGLRDAKNVRDKSAKRIEWFLALQRIHEFPAHPIAPFPVKYRLGRLDAFNGDPLGYSAARTSRWLPIYPRLSNGIRLSVSPDIRVRNAVQTEFLAALASPTPMPQLGWPLAVSTSKQYAASSRKIFDKGTSEFQSAARLTSEVEPFGVQPTRPTIPADPRNHFGAGAALPCAFLTGHSDNGQFPGPAPWRPPVAGHAFVELPQERISRLSDGQIEPEYSRQRREGSASGKPDQLTSEDDCPARRSPQFHSTS